MIPGLILWHLHSLKSHMKLQYFSCLRLSKMSWHRIEHFLFFDPPYNPMRLFSGPIFQNAQMMQGGMSLFLCQDMLKSQKSQENCNHTWLVSARFILVNPRMLHVGNSCSSCIYTSLLIVFHITVMLSSVLIF